MRFHLVLALCAALAGPGTALGEAPPDAPVDARPISSTAGPAIADATRRQNGKAAVLRRATAISHRPGRARMICVAATKPTPARRCLRTTKNSATAWSIGRPECEKPLISAKPAR